jgi:hypothetical protein
MRQSREGGFQTRPYDSDSILRPCDLCGPFSFSVAASPNKSSVIPAQAGIQVWRGAATKMDAGLRRHDDETTAKFIRDF